MARPVTNNSFSLSYNVLRNGTASFQNSTTQEAARCLNRVGHCCLNVFTLTTLIIALMTYIYDYNSSVKKMPDFLFILYAIAMWMQLATVRYRNLISLSFTVVTELIIFGTVLYASVSSFINYDPEVRGYVFLVLFIFITVCRLVFMLILFKVLKFKNPHFALSTTVFLNPTNTPVTFSSIMAPQELDPTNPYYPQTVYNNNLVQCNLLDKSQT